MSSDIPNPHDVYWAPTTKEEEKRLVQDCIGMLYGMVHDRETDPRVRKDAAVELLNRFQGKPIPVPTTVDDADFDVPPLIDTAITDALQHIDNRARETAGLSKRRMGVSRNGDARAERPGKKPPVEA